MKKLFLAAVAVALAALIIPLSVQAATTSDTIDKNFCSSFQKANPTLKPPAGCDNQKLAEDPDGKGPGKSYLGTLVDGFIFVAGTVAFIFLIVGAVRYLTATGNSSRIQQAKDTVLYSVIGLIVVALSKPIADFIIKRVAGG